MNLALNNSHAGLWVNNPGAEESWLFEGLSYCNICCLRGNLALIKAVSQKRQINELFNMDEITTVKSNRGGLEFICSEKDLK